MPYFFHSKSSCPWARFATTKSSQDPTFLQLQPCSWPPTCQQWILTLKEPSLCTFQMYSGLQVLSPITKIITIKNSHTITLHQCTSHNVINKRRLQCDAMFTLYKYHANTSNVRGYHTFLLHLSTFEMCCLGDKRFQNSLSFKEPNFSLDEACKLNLFPCAHSP